MHLNNGKKMIKSCSKHLVNKLIYCDETFQQKHIFANFSPCPISWLWMENYITQDPIALSCKNTRQKIYSSFIVSVFFQFGRRILMTNGRKLWNSHKSRNVTHKNLFPFSTDTKWEGGKVKILLCHFITSSLKQEHSNEI